MDRYFRAEIPNQNANTVFAYSHEEHRSLPKEIIEKNVHLSLGNVESLDASSYLLCITRSDEYQE